MKLTYEPIGKVAVFATMIFAGACTTSSDPVVANPGSVVIEAGNPASTAKKPDHREAMVARRGKTAGIGRAFNAPYDKTVTVTKLALANQKLTITGVTSGENQTIITFSSPLSLFSYGEVGRVIVSNAGVNQTRLYVTTARRVPGNISAKTEKAFAKDIYGEIIKLLGNG